MRNLKYVAVLLSILCCAGCSNMENVPESEVMQEPERYTISLGVGDGTESRASGTTIYGINVWFDKDKDGSVDDIYAYGLFDDPSKMSLTLLSGYKYGFDCSAVKDAKSKLYYGPYDGNTFAGYAAPFQTSSSSSTMLENKFYTGVSTKLSGLYKGKAVLKSGDASYTSVDYPSLERYYGEVTGYTPVKDGVVNIPLKKTYFGNKLKVKGKLDGKVTVTCKIGSTEVWSKSTTNEMEEKGTIYSYYDVYDCWKNESNLTATITMSYNSNRGDYWDLSNSKTITFKRNVMTTITINVNPDYSSGAFSVLEEEMDEDNYIDFGINDEGELDVTVNPDEEE